MIAKGGSFNIMYSLGLLIVELEISRRRLLEVFEVPDGKRTNGFRAPPIPDGPPSIGLLPRLKTSSRGTCRRLISQPDVESKYPIIAAGRLT